MKDFGRWFEETAEYLRVEEPLEACPEPCAVCGSAEEVCKCEEEDYRQWQAEREQP